MRAATRPLPRRVAESQHVLEGDHPITNKGLRIERDISSAAGASSRTDAGLHDELPVFGHRELGVAVAIEKRLEVGMSGAGGC